MKPDTTLSMENHFPKRLINPIAITSFNQQNKWVDSSSLLYLLHEYTASSFILVVLFSVTEPEESTFKADKFRVHDVEIKSTLIE